MTKGRLRTSLLAAGLMLLSACQRSTGGPLEPVPSGWVQAGEGTSAVIRDGDLVARVTARWSSTGENSMRISYRNSGTSSRQVAIGTLAMTHATGEAALRTAVDATGVDLADARTDNDRSRVLFALENGTAARSVLDVPAGASRDVDAELTTFSNDGAVQVGDEIVAKIPMGAGSVAAAFVARAP